MALFYRLLKSFFFLLPAEFVHRLALALTAFWGYCYFALWRRQARGHQRVHTTPRPIDYRLGLAAGFIKDPKYRWFAPVLKFDFVEIGTLTRYPQAGNPKPRLFRLRKDRALLNRFGFNNPGYHHALQRLKGPFPIAVGANIGKGKRTQAGQLFDELAEGLMLLMPQCDFFVINLSSPNTPGLRQLLEPDLLGDLCTRLVQVRRQAARFWQLEPRPLYLKLHPDLDQPQRDRLIAWLAQEPALDGVVVSNTTTMRTDLTLPAETVAAMGPGGLSGAPLQARRQELLLRLRAALPDDKKIIAVGGIDSAAQAQQCIEAGASALELYSGLIFEGPGLVKAIKQMLSRF